MHPYYNVRGLVVNPLFVNSSWKRVAEALSITCLRGPMGRPTHRRDDGVYQQMTKHAQNLYKKHQAAKRIIRSDSLKGELAGYMEWVRGHGITPNVLNIFFS